MRTTSTSLFMSLDGAIEAENDWQFPFLDEQTFAALTCDWDRSDAALLGRRTFDGFNDVRRSAPDSPVIGFLDRVARYVVSTSTFEPDWDGTSVLSGDVAAEVRHLKQQPGENILVIGSPTLVRWLLANGLLDTLAVTVLPVIVGSGPRLTPDQPGLATVHRLPLTLTGSRQLGNGTMHTTYAPGASSR